MKKILLFAFALTIVFVSCKTLAPGPTAPTLQSITLNKDTLIMHVGDATTIGYSLNPTTISKKVLTWQSSDATIVAVTDSGTLTAKKVGSAIITVSNADKTVTANALITVLAAIPAVDSLKVGLLAYYPFDNSGDDFSGNENHGSVVNISSATDRFGNVNGAYHFDGFSSYIVVPDKSALRLNNTDFTINYWVNLDQYSSLSGSAILAKNNGPFQNGWNCSITGNGDVDPGTGAVNYGHAFYNVSGGGDPYAIGSAVLPTGQWGMVTVEYKLSSKTLTFYVNGVMDVQTSNIPTPNGATNVNLFIGKNSYSGNGTPSYFLQGTLDDIRIYNRALSADLIHKLYTATN